MSMHLEHEFLHSHDGHAQEVHPHDLHVVASGHAQLSGPQASSLSGSTPSSRVGRKCVEDHGETGCPRSVGRTSAVGRTRGSLAPRVCVCFPARNQPRENQIKHGTKLAGVVCLEPHYLDCIL